MALTFTGRVAIVTGAGGGLGRAYALLLASRGCAVLVNDLGVATSGEGGDQRPADRVVAEIRAAGGTAAANYNSATDGPALVAAAISTFGGVHIVICNAGILRDKSFQKMTDAEWDALYKVHLFAAFSLARAAWGRFKDQGYGRIIFIGSAAGLYGNVGQANYSAFKLALVGLAHTLAIEGGKKGIQTNVVIPIAGSRMTETVLPADLVEALKPAYVAPFVAWLCHDSCPDNDGVYEVGAGWAGKLRWQRSAGAFVGGPAAAGKAQGARLTPEDARDAWAAVNSFSGPEAVPAVSNHDAFGIIMAKLGGAAAK